MTRLRTKEPVGMTVNKQEFEAAKTMIKEDIRAGVVAETVREFAKLHDYVDGNVYVEAAFERGGIPAANDLIDAIEAWLRAIPDVCPHSAMQNMGGACEACSAKAWA